MTPFFHLLFHLYPFVHFIFAFQDLENSVPWGPPLHYLLVYKIHFHMPKMTLWSLLAYIYFFLQKVCKLLVYNMFCSQYDNKLTPIPWTKLNLRKKIIWCEARNWKPYKQFVLSQNFLYWFGNCSSKKLLNCSVWQEPWEFKKCHVWVCVSYLHPQFLPLMCLFVTSYEFLIFRHWNVSMIHYFVTNIFKGISRLLLLYYDLCKYLKDSNGNEK